MAPAPVREWVAIRGRMQKIAGDEAPVLAGPFFSRLRAFTRDLPAQWAVTTMRFFLNCWTTTRRMHLCAPEDCIFGCAAPDALGHYMVCLQVRVVLEGAGMGPCVGLSLSDCFGLHNRPLEDTSAAFMHVAVARYHAARGRKRAGPLPPARAREVAVAYGRDVLPELLAASQPAEVRAQHPAARGAARRLNAGRPSGHRSAPPSGVARAGSFHAGPP